MIQSAVVVPEPEEQHQESTPSLKRRQSSISSETSSKRPRLSPRNSTEHGSSNKMSPPPAQRNPSQANTSTGAQERQRTQRLFGNVFSNLNKTSAKPAHRRRDEIEKRQQERLKLQTEEAAEEKRKRREEVDTLRKRQQKAWNEQSMLQRHRNMKATAQFLKTTTRPHLYYKPWELREEDEEQIKSQTEQVDATIKEELAKYDSTSAADTEMTEVHRPVSKILPSSTELDAQTQASNGDVELVGAYEKNSDTDKQDNSAMITTATYETTPPCETVKDKNRPRIPDEKPHDEHGGEELVEGQEDDVIY